MQTFLSISPSFTEAQTLGEVTSTEEIDSVVDLEVLQTGGAGECKWKLALQY